jgi:hypothetical protein
MISRLTIVLPAVIGAALFASSACAQGRGMRAAAPAPRTGVSFRLGGRPGVVRVRPRRFFAGSVFLSSPYFYPGDDYDYELPPTEERPVQVVFEQPAQPPAPMASPAEALVLEYRDGQWVRIPANGRLPAMQPDSAQASSLRPGTADRNQAVQPLPELPPAVLVFRDGRQEEVKRYTIKGDVIYTSADYWSTGSWTRKVPMAELDIAATLKLNADRGGKFTLPSGPNEIVTRF